MRRTTISATVLLAWAAAAAATETPAPAGAPGAGEQSNSRAPTTTVNPQSPSGLDYYSQGGVVVDGVAYFTANDVCRRPGTARNEENPCVAAIDLNTLQVIRRYPFSFTYDSSPLVYQTKDGLWLVIAHEHKRARTVAMNRDSGEVVWTSHSNQPGSMFFGYSYFLRPDGSRLIFMSAANGLHALSGETGKEAWCVSRRSSGGVTPCVDQRGGWIYYQCDGQLLKVRAGDGAVLKSTSVAKPSSCVSWNTVLINDSHGYLVATYWYGGNEWDGAIRVYDKDLALVWEKTGLPTGKKATLTYADGKLVTGSGNQWHARYQGDQWKYIAAYKVHSGEVAWKCDLSKHIYHCILNVPYFNGCFYAETQDDVSVMPGVTSKVFRIDGASGKLEEVLDFGHDISSCATSIIARGKLLSGDLIHDRLVVTRLAEDAQGDWPGPFGDPQLHHMAAPTEPGARIVPMRVEDPR
ncbi:MAG: PQQ-binding-like beta-propeller repeat protein [Pirellulales bacterium]|nr:PQQ-binding-like beta-propeller repeat protein [Pirellulales bacterium]